MKHLMIGGVLCLFLLGGGTRAEAQEVASSFHQLAVLLKPGDRIEIVDVNGVQTEGRLGRLSRDVLILSTPNGPLQLVEDKVTTITQRRGDSLANGAIIGAIAGTTCFVTLATLLRDADGGRVIVSTAITGGLRVAALGAAIGAGVDALFGSTQVIFEKPAGRTSVAVSPLVGRGVRGAAVAVRF